MNDNPSNHKRPEKKCEMFGCNNDAVITTNIAPATTVNICDDCWKSIEKDRNG